MDKQKTAAPKTRKDKKKNTETGLLMGQNTNIFSQLSATYLQNKSSTTQQQINFVKQTQIVQYHDPNINRLIALLRKKADVTKVKAALQLKQEIYKMNQDNIQEFIQTFSHLFMEIIINQQSKQVTDQFVSMVNFILTNFKKIIIKEISTIFGPFFVINRTNNINQIKIYGMLFNGTQQQLHQKAITLLLSKNVIKKFLVFCRVIIQCQESHKIGQQNFQRNCTSLLKIIKDLIKSYDLIQQKKQQIKIGFSNFMDQINQIVSSKFVQQYFKVGGKAKSTFLEFYQTLISSAAKHPQWEIDWENYAKILCQNYLDKDIVVQNSLWKYCNKQFIQSTLQLQKIEKQGKQQMKQQGMKQKQKQKYWIFTKYLPKPDQKLLNALKIGGQTLYKQLPSYCTVFPYTILQKSQTHKSIINKITYIRKIMQTILQSQDENQTRIQCYYQLSLYFIKLLRNIQNSIKQLDQKKQQQIKTLATKAQKQMINSLEEKYYKNPPVSRNSFTFNVPTFYCKILEQVQPTFDFHFDKVQTFSLYNGLTNGKNLQYSQNLYHKIYQNCKDDQSLLLKYLQNFPTKSVPINMSQTNPQVQQASKIFLLSTQSQNPQNWFKQNWDIRKKLIAFDPRISSLDLSKIQQQQTTHIHHTFNFRPSNKNIINQKYFPFSHDTQRFNYFIECLNNQQYITMIPYMLPMIKQIIINRNNFNRITYINKLLDIHSGNIQKLYKKQWIVSQTQVLKIRVIYQLILQGIKNYYNQQNQQSQQKINEKLFDSFLNSYCLFALTIYNYKLQNQSQQLLKLLTKVIYIDKISQKIFKSAKQSINQAYQTFAKVGAHNKQMKQGQDKQRKNRLNRMLNFIKKVLWYAINKKKQQHYLILFQDILTNSDWKYAEFRSDLWLMCECLLQIMGEKDKRNVIKKIVSQHQKYKHFITLLMCCQLILSLQRHPSAKKIIIQLQNQILKQVKQNGEQQGNLNILGSMITQSIQDDSFLLIFGSKNLLKNLMKNYQKLSPQILQKYVQICLKKPLQQLQKSTTQTGFERKCILLINLCTQLPLLDLPNIQKIYQQLYKQTQSQKNPIKILGYFGILSTIWQSSVGIDKITQENITQMINKSIQSLKQILKQNNIQKSNFARFCALTFYNQLVQLKSKDILKQYQDYILSQVVWNPVQQGTLLHGSLQSTKYKYISHIFSSSTIEMKTYIVCTIPQQIIKQIKFYKEILDNMQNQDKDIQQNQGYNHYQNIINMFIEFAQVLVRIIGGLTKQIKPSQQIILQLLQCPFAGIKKTAFLLLKQMYQLNLVQKNPPNIFLTYLKLQQNVTKNELDPLIINIISGYLYSWQAIIERRKTTQRPSQKQQQIYNNITLQDYLQNQQLYQIFLKNVFEILENQLQYIKNQQDFYITAEQLIEIDTIVTVQDDMNMYNKMFRLTIRTLFMFIQNFPLFLRNFMDKNKKYKNICDRLLRNVISDAIFKQQVKKIQMREHQWKSAGNFQIYVTTKVKQIYAQYTHDVIRIGLRLLMKGNYPLTPITIQFGEGLKLDEGSRWALMLQNQLHSRNNTIINGILLWKENIDKKLAGVQQCAICFDIVNSQGQLPKKGCKTCKKRFHNVCIMKWFSKSNKSQCPLCKSQFL